MSDERNTALVEARFQQWVRVNAAVRAELEVAGSREIMTRLLTPEGDPDATIALARIREGMAMARIVTANDRAAALVAAQITQYGIKPLPLDDFISDGGS